MSKKGGSDFQNRAANKFKQPDRIDLMKQSEIFEIFDEDIETILNQVTSARQHRGKYPTYVANAFANLSTSLWFKNYVDDHIKIKKSGKIKADLDEDQVESLRTLIAEGYKKSATNQYAQQTMEFQERNKILSTTFIKLYWDVYKMTRKLKITKSLCRDLCIQIYGDPVNNFKFIHKSINCSPLSDKAKLKLLKKMYAAHDTGDHDFDISRFDMACGAALTVDSNNSDCISMIYDYVMHLKMKKAAPIIHAYTIAFKKNKTSNFRATTPEFYKHFRKLLKELEDVDIGYKKAIKASKKAFKSDKKKKDKKKDAKVTVI